MFQKLFHVPIFFITFLYSCSSPTSELTTSNYMTDPHSFSKPDDAVVKHLVLDLNVDFEKKNLSGSATVAVELKNNSTKIILDTRDLNIEKVTLDDGSDAKFSLGDEVQYLGRALTINLKPQTKNFTVYYSTNPDATALQWLEPSQTAGKKLPFLFTQSQAILARTWVPIQDSPGIRFTYSATVKVPANMLALMSAENPQEKNSDGVYHFEMKQPVPAYLLALSVGNISFKPTGSRTGVYAEPEMIDQSVYEFADMEKMVNAAEELYGPYRWGRYDLIVLPPSFPFGGMENPRLTFATPTVIAGDRSLTSLIAHELAHSWSGNLVTNATWDDFWINEGFTVYFENRIMEKIYGKDFADMNAALGMEELKGTIKDLGDTSADTHLKLNLAGRDPDDGVTDVAYQKGCLFLRMLEETVGRQKLDAFLRKYFDAHAFKSMDTETLAGIIRNDLLGNDSALLNKVNMEAWIYGPGLPANCPVVESERFEKTDEELKKWNDGAKASALETKNFSTQEWLRFLAGLPEKISADRMKELDDAFGFTKSGNSEILCEWFQHCIRNNYSVANPFIENYLINIGRRKLVKPLYAGMILTPEGKVMAKMIYAKARPNYHAVTYHTID
ncbi:MAG: M1 family metallopeptidase, partial [Bacteroidia bacterium]|nr:M1 family metallopeptidase [Bacteroidia bacterium]